MAAAPDDLTYVTTVLTAALPNSRYLTATSINGIELQDGGGQNPLNIAPTLNLKALIDLSSNGIIVRTSNSTLVTRSVVSTDMSLTVTNGSGVTGNIDLSVNDDISIQRVDILQNGSLESTRRAINFIPGSGAGVTVVEDALNNRTNVTITASGPSLFFDEPFVTYTASTDLTNEFNLGSLTTGILKHTVLAGSSTPATAVPGADYFAPGIPFYVFEDLNNFIISTNEITTHTSGDDCTGLGKNIFANLTSGLRLSAFGTNTLNSVTSQIDVTGFGYRVMEVIQVGADYNTGFGSLALTDLTTGTSNTGTGYLSLGQLTTGSFNTANGFSSLFSLQTGSGMTGYGYSSGRDITTGTNSVLIGFTCSLNTTTCTRAVTIGAEAHFNNTTTTESVTVGTRALYNSVTTLFNTTFGFEAQFSATSTNGVISVGYRSLYSHTSPTDIVAIGNECLYSLTTGSSIVAIGSRSGELLTSSGSMILIGTDIGFNALTSANDSVLIGDGAAGLNVSCTNSVGIGEGALSGTNVTTGNTGIGFQALNGATTYTITNCSSLGASTLLNISSNTTNSTGIGANVQITGSNQVNLGNDCKIGIGTFTPLFGLDLTKGTNQDAYIHIGDNTTNPTYIGATGVVLASKNTELTVTTPNATYNVGRFSTFPTAGNFATAGKIVLSGTGTDGANADCTANSIILLTLQDSGPVVASTNELVVNPGAGSFTVYSDPALSGKTLNWIVINAT